MKLYISLSAIAVAIFVNFVKDGRYNALKEQQNEFPDKLRQAHKMNGNQARNEITWNFEEKQMKLKMDSSK